MENKAERIKNILEKENLQVVKILKENEIATTIKVSKDFENEKRYLILKVFNFETANNFEELEDEQEKRNLDYFENEKNIYGQIYPDDYYFGNNFIVTPDWGIDLKKYLNQDKISKRLIYYIIEQILQVVISLHQKKIYHNDLRWSNFVFNPNSKKRNKQRNKQRNQSNSNPQDKKNNYAIPSNKIKIIDFQDSFWDDSENNGGNKNWSINQDFDRNKDLTDLISLFNSLDEKYNLHLQLNQKSFLSLADLNDYLQPKLRKRRNNLTKYSLVGLPILLCIFSINFLLSGPNLTQANESNDGDIQLSSVNSKSTTPSDSTVSKQSDKTNSVKTKSDNTNTLQVTNKSFEQNTAKTSSSEITQSTTSPNSTSQSTAEEKTKTTPKPKSKVKKINLNLFQNRSQSQIIVTFELKNFTKSELSKGKIYFQINNYGWQILPDCNLNNSGCILNNVDKLKNYTFRISIGSISSQKAIVTY